MIDLTGFGSAFEFAKVVVDKVFPPKADPTEKLKAQTLIQQMTEQRENEILKAQKEVLVAEIQGDSWLQRSWRPILMLSIVAIVVNNYILFPYLSLFFDKVVMLELPEKLYNLMTVGVGGYICGRTGERVVKEWKK